MRRFLAASLIVAITAATAPAQERVLRHEAVVHASPEELWEFWTTPAGWKKLGIAQAEIDFRLGGQIRTHYSPEGVLGDDGTIINTILAYEPQRMLAFRATAPKNAPAFIQEICKTGWSVLRLEPLSPTTTRVVISGMGYGEGELHDQAYAFFDRGNAWTMEKLKAAFPGAEEQSDAAGALLGKLVGEWEFSNTRPDGTIFRGRTTVQPLFGGRVLVATGLLGGNEAMFHHSHWVACKDPVSGQYRLWSWNQSADVATGELRPRGDATLEFDWNAVQSKDGKAAAYSGEYIFDGDDAYDCVLYQHSPEGRKQMVKVRYTRCAPGTAPLPVTGQAPESAS